MIKSHRLQCGHFAADIAEGIGANVTSLTYDGRDVLVPLTSEEQLAVDPYVQGAPLLFPANRTAGGCFVFDGCAYTLPVNETATGANLHGMLHRQAFTVLDRSDTEMTLLYRNRGEVFPFDFDITVTYRLTSDGFFSAYDIVNTGDCAMPVTFALHTSFVEPTRFAVPIDACLEKDSRHIPTGRYVPLSPQEKGYVTGSPSKDLVISGYYRASGNTARIGDYVYVVSSEFDHWTLYNGRGEQGLLCVEPQCGKVNGLNFSDGHRRLAAKEKLSLWTEIRRESQS